MNNKTVLITGTVGCVDRCWCLFHGSHPAGIVCVNAEIR